MCLFMPDHSSITVPGSFSTTSGFIPRFLRRYFLLGTSHFTTYNIYLLFLDTEVYTFGVEVGCKIPPSKGLWSYTKGGNDMGVGLESVDLSR